MISKEEAHQIAKEYLLQKKRKYTNLAPLEKVLFLPDEEILYGKDEGKKVDMYSIGYGQIWGNDEKSMFINISAKTGQVLYTISPHGWVEEVE